MKKKMKLSRRSENLIFLAKTLLFLAVFCLNTWWLFRSATDASNSVETFISGFVEILFIVKLIHGAKMLADMIIENENSGGRLTKYFGKKLRQLKEQLTKKKKPDNFWKGESETSFEFNRAFSGRLGKIFDSRKKINLKRCRTNDERVRMMYIKRFLMLKERNEQIDFSTTPMEAAEFDISGNRPLFETYDRLRYDEDFSVTDDVMPELKSVE